MQVGGAIKRGGALFVVQRGEPGLATLPGEGRRVLAADSSAAPGSLLGRQPTIGELRTNRLAVPDP